LQEVFELIDHLIEQADKAPEYAAFDFLHYFTLPQPIASTDKNEKPRLGEAELSKLKPRRPRGCDRGDQGSSRLGCMTRRSAEGSLSNSIILGTGNVHNPKGTESPLL
jgi:hypothetical protein